MTSSFRYRVLLLVLVATVASGCNNDETAPTMQEVTTTAGASSEQTVSKDEKPVGVTDDQQQVPPDDQLQVSGDDQQHGSQARVKGSEEGRSDVEAVDDRHESGDEQETGESGYEDPDSGEKASMPPAYPSPDPITFTAVTAGSYHSCGLAVDGSVICWGDNTSEQSDPPPGLSSR